MLFETLAQAGLTLCDLTLDLIRFLGRLFQSRSALAAENLFLGKQLALYPEGQIRPRRATAAIRLSLLGLGKLFDWKEALMAVRPATFTDWHRPGFKWFWRWKSQRIGRPRIPADIALFGCQSVFAHDRYAWLFATPQVSLYKVRLTRAATVAEEVFGQAPVPGVLVVDRYAVYQSLRCALQFCYAHLLREVKDLTKEFPDEAEVARFVAAFAPRLAEPMGLRRQPIRDAIFYQRAQVLQARIVALVERPAQHLGIQRIQDIFREQAHRLYHWAAQRPVPADNNFCEQKLRSLVIARKVSFGSQSERGARTREILIDRAAHPT